MAQAIWMSNSDRRSDFNPSDSSSHPPRQPVDLARWELAEFLKSSSHLPPEAAAAQAQAMFSQPFATYADNVDGISTASINDPNCLDSVPNNYSLFHNHQAVSNNDFHTSVPNYVLGAQRAYPAPSQSNSLYSSNHQPFNMSSMASSFTNGKDHLNGISQHPDFSFSSLLQNGSNHGSHLSTINSSNPFHSPDFNSNFDISAMSNLGIGLATMGMQPQFTHGLDHFQQEGQYSSASGRTTSPPTHFTPNQSVSSDMRRDVHHQRMDSFDSQASNNYDTMRNYIGSMSDRSSSTLGLPQQVEDTLRITSPPSNPNVVTDVRVFIKPYLEQYVRTSNRLTFGERTIVVMSSKVAQKSYGSEKRFLCPPPTAIMVGNSWWTDVAKSGEPTKLCPPRVTISISGEPSPSEGSIEWAGASGKLFDIVDPPTGTTYVGRCVGKQLYISEADEKRKKVEALVKVTAKGPNDDEKVVGIFPSKPIKVISKPSKKRQSAKNLELCINHGSTVSLFHRLRSQTVSTKYLCVSASGSAFKGSDGAPLMGDDVRSSPATPAFVARTSSWDPFIMYIVDVNKPIGGIDAPPPPPQPDYPSPPPNAIPFTNNGSQIPIYYNQTIVLQCLTSGVVSPILIIRKVDRQTTVVGGGNQEGAKSVPDHYCAAGEVYGDPVSQLHKIAFEVYEPNKPEPEPGTPGESGAFLACIVEKVNTSRPVEGRQWNTAASNQVPDSPLSAGSASPTASTSASSNASPDYFSAGGSLPPSPAEPDIPNTNDGGRVRKGKRATNSAGGLAKGTAVKSRKRPTSAGSAGSKRVPLTDSPTAGTSSGALWHVDIGETSVWTIVGTEQIRYNFYVPPILFDSQGCAPANSFPIPNKPVTPFPSVFKCLPPDRASEAPKGHGTRVQVNPPTSKMLTLYGENFAKTDILNVFFGSESSSYVEVRCTEVLGCLPPEIETAKRRPIILVREDGVVFPSSTLYP